MSPLPVVSPSLVESWCRDLPRDRARVAAALAAGPAALTARDLLDLPLGPADRLWLVLRPEVLPELVRHAFAGVRVEYALLEATQRGEAVDPRLWAAQAAKRGYLEGEITRAELEAARDGVVAAWARAAAAGCAAAVAVLRATSADAREALIDPGVVAPADQVDLLRLLLAEPAADGAGAGAGRDSA